MKYLNGISNIQSLKEKYLELIKENHPIFHSKRQYLYYMGICMEIENEFKNRFKQLRSMGMTVSYDMPKERGFLLMENIKASNKRLEFMENISSELIKLPIYKKYYENDFADSNSDIVNDGFIIASGKDLISDIFYSCFSELCLDLDDVTKIYELCDCNVEKFKRVILFLREGYLEPFDFRTNLYSDDTIPFFDDEISEEDIPDYNSSLVIVREISTSESIRGWNRFCNKQSECFDEKYYAKLMENPKVAVKK